METEVLQKEEVLRVARMALQTEAKTLIVNGITIRVLSSEQGLEVYHGTEKLLDIQER